MSLATLALVLLALAPQSSLKPASYIARGNEPGWVLSMTGSEMVLTQQDGPEIKMPQPKAQVTGDTTRYGATLNGKPMTVDVAHRLCHDGMSGVSYPDAVTVAAGGKVLKGCGGDPASLLAGEWTVESIGGVAALAQAKPTLSFTDAGRIAGSGSCNRYSASYTLTGEGLKIGPAASTRMACAPALSQQEDTFFKILGTVFRHDVTDTKTLVLEGTGGKKIVAKR